jgi:Tol biopolymer transport system component
VIKQSRSRRKICAALAGLLGATVIGGCGESQSAVPSGPAEANTPGPAPETASAPPVATPQPATGTLVIIQKGNLYSYDVGTQHGQPITQFAKGAYAWSPSVSHDHKRLAYAYFVAPKSATDLGSSDLYVADARGANAKLLRAHPVAGATFEDPCWTADGQAILATLRQPVYDADGTFQGSSVTIVHVGADGSGPSLLVKDAMGPGTSPDGKYLAYTGVDTHGAPAGLFVGDPTGGSAAPMLDDQGFKIMRFPAFAPDSSRLVFAAIGGPLAETRTSAVGWLPPGFAVAEADGPPWELWSVRPDGTELRRLTKLSEDTPVPAWSPNGAWIAVAGSYGLYLIDPIGVAGPETRVSKIVSGGGVAWPI